MSADTKPQEETSGGDSTEQRKYQTLLDTIATTLKEKGNYSQSLARINYKI